MGINVEITDKELVEESDEATPAYNFVYKGNSMDLVMVFYIIMQDFYLGIWRWE